MIGLLIAVPVRVLADGPAGSVRVFSVLQEGRWQLYWQAGETAASRPVPIPEIRGDQLAARLAPDGRRVAFEVTGQGLFVCPLSPEGAEAAAAMDCRHLRDGSGDPVRPAWNPATGELLLVRFEVSASGEESRIEVASSDLAETRPVLEQTGIQDFPDVSPDGSHLVYTAWQTVMPFRSSVQVIQQLWVLDLSRGKAGQLLLSNASDIHPRWSPDGHWLAFASNRTGRYEIWVAAADGQRPRQATHGPGDKTWPAWSPDGGRLLFTHAREGHLGLSSVNLATGEMVSVAPLGQAAHWQIRDADWVGVPVTAEGGQH